MDKVKKVYVDSRYKANGSVSNSDFKFDSKEALDLPDNTVRILYRWYQHSSYMVYYRRKFE